LDIKTISNTEETLIVETGGTILPVCCTATINNQPTKDAMLNTKQLKQEPYQNGFPTVKTALEFGQVRDLFKIVDDLVQIRNNAMFNTVEDENKFNFILSELQFYHREIDYAKLIEENKIFKY